MKPRRVDILPLLTPAVVARLWSRVVKSAGCWEYALYRGMRYGRMGIGGAYYAAHRISFALHSGAEPGEGIVCHSCDNPPCVRPEHLRLADQTENMEDCRRRGRFAVGSRASAARLVESEVIALRGAFRGGESMARLAARYGVSPSQVSRIVRGELWSHLAGAIPGDHRRAWNRQLSDGDVMAIRARRACGEKLNDIAADYGINFSMVSAIAHRRAYAGVA